MFAFSFLSHSLFLAVLKDWLGYKAHLQELEDTFWSSFSSPFWLVSGSVYYSLITLGEFRCKYRNIMYPIAFKSATWKQTQLSSCCSPATQPYGGRLSQWPLHLNKWMPLMMPGKGGKQRILASGFPHLEFHPFYSCPLKHVQYK